MSKIIEISEIMSSQKNREFRYPSFAMDAIMSSIKKPTKQMSKIMSIPKSEDLGSKIIRKSSPYSTINVKKRTII